MHRTYFFPTGWTLIALMTLASPVFAGAARAGIERLEEDIERLRVPDRRFLARAWGEFIALRAESEDRERLLRVQRRLRALEKGMAAGPSFRQSSTGGGSITGRVTASDTGLPLAGVYVFIFTTDSMNQFSGVTDSDGFYAPFEPLPAGEYWVRVFAGQVGYLDEGYDNIPCDHHCSVPLGVTVVPVAEGQETAGIDFVLDPGGKIAGTVTDATTGLPVAGLFVDVVVHPGGSPFFYQTDGFTDAAGAYETFDVVGPGTYLAFTSLGSEQEAYLGELYQDIDCFPNCDLSLGTPIPVVGGQTTAGIDFTPLRGGTIAGRVVDRHGGGPLPDISVTVYDVSGQFLENTHTGEDGRYRSRKGLIEGSYFLVARDFFTQTHVDQIYGGPFCFDFGGDCDPTQGTPVSVTLGQQTTGIGFRMEEGGHVAGSVSDSSTGNPLGFPTAVFFFEWPSLRLLDGVFANRDGSYAGNEALPKGKYLVLATSPDHIDELHQGIPCESGCDARQGDRVKVLRGETSDGIDFSLEPGPPPADLLTQGSKPEEVAEKLRP